MTDDSDKTPVATPFGPTAVGDSTAVTRARRTLRRLAIALPLLGVVLIALAIAAQVVGGGSMFGTDPASEFAGMMLTFVGPALLVLGLHMVVWRALVRPLTRMSPGSRVGTIIGVGAALSFVSVILVILLVFLGLLISSLLLFDATGQSI